MPDGKGLVVNLKCHYLNGKSVQITPENERCLSFFNENQYFLRFWVGTFILLYNPKKELKGPFT